MFPPTAKRAKTSDGASDRNIPNHLRCHNGAHLSDETKESLANFAKHLATPGKGITACDESAGTIGQRFQDCMVQNTDENRRKYRQCLFETPGINEYLSGAILDPETLLQISSTSSKPFPEVLTSLGILPGVKPHLKVYTLPGTGGDTVMQGLDNLATRLNEYYKQGARFTKWRAPLEIDISSGRPTRFAIEANMRDLSRFALISQAEGMVPLVEPDVVMKGSHTLEIAIAINTEIMSMLYHSMIEQVSSET